MPEVLPPIERLPKDVRPGVPLDQLAHNADWAETFAPSDVSFAQRFRHNRDIREYGEALQAQKAAAIEAQARTNQTAQNFFFRDKELDLKRQEQEQDMRFKHELHPLTLEAKQAAANASRALELARITAEKTGAERARIAAEKLARAKQHSLGFEQHMNELEARGVGPDNPEYRDGFEIGRKTFPFAEREVIEGYKAALPPVPDTLTPFQQQQAALAPGKAVVEKVKELDDWKEKRAKVDAEKEPNAAAFYDEKIAAAEKWLKPGVMPGQDYGGAGAGKPKQVRQNGVIYSLQPDGSYK